jgi:DNA polymerase-3 subunit beta
MNGYMLSIIVETKELSYVLSFASSVVEKRNVLAELSHVKLTANDNQLEILATDMDILLSQKIGAQVLTPGSITVSHQLLADIVKKIPDKEIKLTLVDSGQQLEVKGKNCCFNLLTLPADKFPTLEEISGANILQIPCRDLVQLIEYTQFSMSLDETRYNLNGIYLHAKNEELIAAATDGHRLSVASVKFHNKYKEDFGVILPKKTVHELQKVIKDPKNIDFNIEIQLSLNKVKFSCNNITMISKLIDGTFPDYQDLIPADHPHKMVVNTKLLADAVDRVATITVDKFRAIKFSFKENELEIIATGEAKGAAIEKLPYTNEKDDFCNFSGEEIVIGFNPKYLTDVLSAVKEPQVELLLNNAFSPTLIKLPESSNCNFVVMPVKV